MELWNFVFHVSFVYMMFGTNCSCAAATSTVSYQSSSSC